MQRILAQLTTQTNMEETILKSLEHAPDLLAMIICIVLFTRILKFMLESQNQQAQRSAEAQERSDAIKARHAEVIQGNTEATNRLTKAFEQVSCKYPGGKH